MFVYAENLRPLEVHIQVAEPSVEGLQAHIKYVHERMLERRKLERQQRFAYVVQHNGSEFRQANAAERRLLADWMKEDAELFRTASIGLGFVIESTFIRGALTAVFWLTSTPVPYRVHATLGEAVSVASREITAAGIRLPASLVADPVDSVRREIERVAPTRGVTAQLRT